MWLISAGHLGQPPHSLIKELPSSTPSNSLYEASKNRKLPRAPRIPHGSWPPPGTWPEHPSGTRGTPLPGNGVPRSPTRRSSRCAAQRLAAPSPAGPSTVSVTCGSAFPAHSQGVYGTLSIYGTGSTVNGRDCKSNAWKVSFDMCIMHRLDAYSFSKAESCLKRRANHHWAVATRSTLGEPHLLRDSSLRPSGGPPAEDRSQLV